MEAISKEPQDMSTTTAAAKPAPRKRSPAKTRVELPISSDGSTPKLIVIGRGTLTGTMVEDPKTGKKVASRALKALRLRKSTMERLNKLTAGPDYITADYALNLGLDMIEAWENIRVIRAEELES